MGAGLDGGLLAASCGPAHRTLPAHTALPQAALTLTVLASCVPSTCAPFSASGGRSPRPGCSGCMGAERAGAGGTGLVLRGRPGASPSCCAPMPPLLTPSPPRTAAAPRRGPCPASGAPPPWPPARSPAPPPWRRAGQGSGVGGRKGRGGMEIKAAFCAGWSTASWHPVAPALPACPSPQPGSTHLRRLLLRLLGRALRGRQRLGGLALALHALCRLAPLLLQLARRLVQARLQRRLLAHERLLGGGLGGAQLRGGSGGGARG